MSLPKTLCPKTEKKHCSVCGNWLGWIDLSNPARSPTYEEWEKCKKDMQAMHDKLREREFEMIKIKTVNMIDVYEWDELVKNTYGKPYSFQQQDGCKERGTWEIQVPQPFPEDYENETVEEEVNSDEMGVSFAAWLARDAKRELDNDDKYSCEYELALWWNRNFYPCVDMIANDLHEKGLLPAGEYTIKIDW